MNHSIKKMTCIINDIMSFQLVIICTCTHIIVAAITDTSTKCLVDYDKTSECQQKVMCPTEGHGVMVDTVETQCLDRRYADETDQLDRVIMGIIRRECNGRRTCDLKESLKSRFLMTCSKGTFVTDAFWIIYHCKPVGFDNPLVYNMGDNLQREIPVNTFYLVMSTTAWDSHRSCTLSRDPLGFPFNVTLLHVDLELTTTCKVPGADPCTDIFKVDADGQNTVTYRTKSPPIVPFSYTVQTLTYINVTVSSAFLWIEVKAKNPLDVSCTGSATEDNTTTIMTTQTAVTNSTVTTETSYPVTRETLSPNTTTSTAAYVREDVNSPSVMPYIIAIAVLSSFSLLSLVFNGVLLKKHCDQRMEKDHIYSYPSVSVRDGSYTYSGLDDESTVPKIPAPCGIPLAENEYLQVASYDTEYLDVEHKEYNIPRDNSHSITDNTNY
ncbi:hypothetical protein Btru_071537 [Bulinus truncatus]|nr:hypothetical protein Btru_071537 [Bulinus truncatus]